MWIKYIKLENFASIKVGMKKNKIEIDFSNRENKICLLVAPNGTGKTSLLSTLTPFAGLGNLDVRDSTNLIIKGKSGYKEIHIINNDKNYIIKHFYSPNKDTHSIKSYIELNGYELNINGNVRSFVEVVEKELGLELSFLKLLRLGNNVSNLIKSTATDRKNYLSHLLQELDVYLDMYKKLSMDGRILKAELSHLSDKLKKTGIEDIEYSESSLLTLKKHQEHLTLISNELTADKGALEYILSDIDISEVSNDIKSIERLIKRTDTINDGCSISDYEKLLKDKTKELEKLRTIYVKTDTEIKLKITEIDKILCEIHIKEKELEKELNDSQLISAEHIFLELEQEYLISKNTYSNYKPIMSKNEFNEFYTDMILCQQKIDGLQEYGTKPIKKTIEMMEDRLDVDTYLNSKLLNITNRENGAYYLLTKFISMMDEENFECDIENCGLRKVKHDIRKLISATETRTDKDESFYKGMDHVHKVLTEVYHILNKNADRIELLPDKVLKNFRNDKFTSNIIKMKPFIDREDLNNILSELTEYDNHLLLEKKYEEAKLKYEFLKTNSKSYYMKDILNSLYEELNKNKTELEILKQTEVINDSELKLVIEEMEVLNETIIGLSKLKELKEELASNQELKIKHQNTLEALKENRARLQSNQISINKTNSDIDVLNSAIRNFKELRLEFNRVTKLYDENHYIKKSVSAKDGIPLEFIQIYMSTIQKIINDLLEIVYDDSLYIRNFNINATEFKIPYVKDGNEINDISYASQGESAFLSIALSFALISESVMKYNVILLDEIDGNLDTENRKKFLSVLERLIELIDAEQIFLISHNNSFAMYPVDVVSLTNEKDNKLSLANYIEIY